MSSFVLGLKNYAVFSGRSGRKDFWMFQLVSFLIVVVLTVVDLAIGTYDDEAGIGILGGIFVFAILVPAIALTARRLHDIGKSGWFQLLFIIPCIGLILWIIWMAQASEPGANRYGPHPAQVGAN